MSLPGRRHRGPAVPRSPVRDAYVLRDTYVLRLQGPQFRRRGRSPGAGWAIAGIPEANASTATRPQDSYTLGISITRALP
ncbi:hypothetical protein GCM10010339_61890 [Streptomyces alanosinicus]|uniref:Uncharacterized protein n=1 Tax=Streptomyces alanosinicus TaxID=68171 RepID=A0A918YNW0_9ACTN|nr:hypothetical protein GCM10010339_61890 [Streptomyces alanosinicus]